MVKYMKNLIHHFPSCYAYYWDMHVKDSQKIKIKKTKTPRITDEGWNSQKQLSGPAKKKMKERKRRKKRLIQSSLQVLQNRHIPLSHLQ